MFMLLICIYVSIQLPGGFTPTGHRCPPVMVNIFRVLQPIWAPQEVDYFWEEVV